MAVLEGKILDSGKTIISQAMIGIDTALPHSFQIGDAFGFAPLASDTSITGSLVFTGAGDLVQVSVLAPDTVRYVCNIPESYGPFNVGNLVLYMTDNDGLVLPFFEVVLPVPVRKIQSSSAQSQEGYDVPGTRLAISIQIKHSEETTIAQVDVITPTYSSFPTFYQEVDVPLGIALTYQQFVVSYDTRTKGPVMYTVDADGVRWGQPFTHQLEDPNFGHVDGGFDGEGYGMEPDDIVWGYYYLTPQSAFTNTNIGDALYKSPFMRNIGGATYLKKLNNGSYSL